MRNSVKVSVLCKTVLSLSAGLSLGSVVSNVWIGIVVAAFAGIGISVSVDYLETKIAERIER